MAKEVKLTGGRITSEVVCIGDRVHRSACANSSFVHSVLLFLEKHGVSYVPYFRGIDDHGREIIDFIDGKTPENLGVFTLEQCCQAVKMIKTLHDCLKNFPDCPAGLTVCHNDLSPCNFLFSDKRPIAIIDWDAAAFGHPLDDLAYAVWMWLDIGNDENSCSYVKNRMEAMLDTYGVPSEDRTGFGKRILTQMDRVKNGIYPTEEQARATRLWTVRCKLWFETFWKNYYFQF